MMKDESKTIELAADEAYGPHRADMVAEIERSRFPEDLNPHVGQQLEVEHENGQTMLVTVTGVDQDKVTLDGNHPLAGKDLTFELILVEIA